MSRRYITWFFGVALALVVIALMGYWWRYGRSPKANFMLPDKANWLINIDLREVEETIFWDALSHPMSYWDDSDGDDDDKGRQPSTGMSTPHQVAFFMLESHSDILFSEPVSIQEKKFSEYADTLVNQEKWESVGNHFVYDTEKHLFYLWDDNALGVAFAKRDKADFVQATISDLLKEKNCASMSEDLSEIINKGAHHFVIWRKQSELTNNEPVVLYGNFDKGSLVIQGEVPFKYTFSTRNKYAKNASVKHDEVLSFYLNLHDNHFSYSDSFYRDFQKMTHLELDSALQYSTGKLSLLVPSIQTKIDSIITYEYDDDFNKIEKVSTQEILAPQVIAQLESKKEQLLFDYFQRRGVVKNIDGVSRFVGLPFVEMEAVAVGRQLVLSSMSNVNLAEVLDSNFLKLDVGCSQYPKMLDYLPFGLDSVQVDLIEGLKLRASQMHKTSSIKVQLKLEIKNQQRNMLGVLATMP